MIRKFSTELAVILAVLLTLVVVHVPLLRILAPAELNLMPAAVAAAPNPELLLKLAPLPIRK